MTTENTMARIPQSSIELVEAYLADYEARYECFLNDDGFGLGEDDAVCQFTAEHFPEALQAYTESVAKAQREICQDNFDTAYEYWSDDFDKIERMTEVYNNSELSDSLSPTEEQIKNAKK